MYTQILLQGEPPVTVSADDALESKNTKQNPINGTFFILFCYVVGTLYMWWNGFCPHKTHYRQSLIISLN